MKFPRYLTYGAVLLLIIATVTLAIQSGMISRQIQEIQTHLRALTKPAAEIVRTKFTVAKSERPNDESLYATVLYELPSKIPFSEVVLLYRFSNDAPWQEATMARVETLTFTATVKVEADATVWTKKAERLGNEIVSAQRFESYALIANFLGR